MPTIGVPAIPLPGEPTVYGMTTLFPMLDMHTAAQPHHGELLASISSTSEQIGVMEVTYINMPNSSCTAQSYTQVKCEFLPRKGLEPTEDQKQAIALLVMLFKGQKIKDCLTTPGVLFPVARGNSWSDAGLGSSYEYHNLEEVQAFLIKEARHVVASAGAGGAESATRLAGVNPAAGLADAGGRRSRPGVGADGWY